jgi:hypothetical protein
VSERPVLVLTETQAASGIHGKKNTENVRIYPNASDGKFIIEVGEEIKTVQILDLMGREIQVFNPEGAGGKLDADISKSPAGVYIVKFAGENGVFSREIIKK